MSLRIEKMISPWILLLVIASFFHPSVEAALRETPQRYNLYSSDEKEFVWVRVFKVASSTTKKVLADNVPDLKQSKPTTIPKEYKNYFKFSFVRNPWDRVVSCYFNKIVTNQKSPFAECFGMSFEEFVDFIDTLDVTSTNSHLKLQTRLMPVEELDFIGRLDNFDNDLKSVCDRLGIPFTVIPHKHKTDHVHYSTYYTPRTRDIIARKYQEDIETFGFTFETEEAAPN